MLIWRRLSTATLNFKTPIVGKVLFSRSGAIYIYKLLSRDESVKYVNLRDSVRSPYLSFNFHEYVYVLCLSFNVHKLWYSVNVVKCRIVVIFFSIEIPNELFRVLFDSWCVVAFLWVFSAIGLYCSVLLYYLLKLGCQLYECCAFASPCVCVVCGVMRYDIFYCCRRRILQQHRVCLRFEFKSLLLSADYPPPPAYWLESDSLPRPVFFPVLWF